MIEINISNDVYSWMIILFLSVNLVVNPYIYSFSEIIKRYSDKRFNLLLYTFITS